MQADQTVAEMANEVLARQAAERALRSAETFEAALSVIVRTEAGQQLCKLHEGVHCNERAAEWHKNLAGERAQERIARSLAK